jgi:diadenosine tetraphosphate (Ap4A) HIT family hydrolase
MKTDSCPFCKKIKSNRDLTLSGDLAAAFPDAFPVTEGHHLVIPRRHVPGFFELTNTEHLAMLELSRELQEKLLREDSSIQGFNLGVNIGAAAGQTVFHCHLHIIPRRKGDVEDPTGGVRSVIPGKGTYPR